MILFDLTLKKETGRMSFFTSFWEALESVLESEYRENSRAEACSVTASLVLEESIVEIRTLKGDESSSLLIFASAVTFLIEFRTSSRIETASGLVLNLDIADTSSLLANRMRRYLSGPDCLNF